ncbi:hypothetical protein B7494_g3863 [Chlorociboria aeruginascens]|nr:hypothetical protein B7494_g3863 [Chlorociboria aeruginascens]
MSKESLDSNRVNYLIWRYLHESGYEETACKLQKEWDLKDPEHALPFAPHVKNHTLVTILNKGLLYNVAEREITSESRGAGGSQAGFFGPVISAVEEDAFEKARKRQHEEEQAQNHQLPMAKRQRLSNGYENGFDENAMEIDEDQNGDGQAYPSPEQLPSPHVATSGPDQGTQIDKVADLGPETTYLDLSDDSTSPPRYPTLLHLEWNPRDASILAAAGSDALARSWILSRTEPNADVLRNPPHQNLLPADSSPSTTVTGLSWASDGSLIGIASEPIEEANARIDIWSTNGSRLAEFEGFDSPVLCVRWNSANTLVLALSPEKDTSSLEKDLGAVVAVMSPKDRVCVRHALKGHDLNEQTLDAAWITNEEFVLCGGDFLRAFRCNGGEISQVKKFETREDYVLSKVAFDPMSRLLATANDTGTINIWDEQGQSRSFNSHQGLITALIWQPLQTSKLLADHEERLLATCGEDGAICIWNARSTESKPRYSMTMGSAVVALAFTPDGAFIAGATTDRVLVWKVDDVHIPRAVWTRGPEPGWQTPQSQASLPDEDQHCLCWDADGQRLAYGVNSMLAVMNFRP